MVIRRKVINTLIKSCRILAVNFESNL
jgi:hypothetical protein